jgi:branched-chain amino acid transport system substrate-binding protein
MGLHRFWLRVVVVLVVAGLVGVACGSSGGSKSSSASTSAAGSATKAAYNVGVIASETNGPQGNTTEVATTANAWQSWVNGHGGINGHPVKVIVEDDGNDPARSTAAVQDLVQNKHVLTFIDDTTQDPAWATYMATTPMTVICGTQTGNGFTCSSHADFVPAGNTVVAGVWGQTYVAKLQGKTTWGVVYCAEIAACAQAVPLNKTFGAQVGVKVVYAQAASSTAPDYTAQCIGLKSAGAEAVFGYAGTTKIAGDCARQGYHPLWILAQGAFASNYRTDANFDGAIGPVGVFPWFDDATAATHEFRQALAKYWPNFDAFISPYNATATWAALQLFKTAAATLPDSPAPTPADTTNAIYALPPNFTLDGLIPPQTLVKGKPNLNPCFYIVQIKNQKYTAPYGLKSYCQGTSS